jgi:hypothetical protein
VLLRLIRFLQTASPQCLSSQLIAERNIIQSGEMIGALISIYTDVRMSALRVYKAGIANAMAAKCHCDEI